MAGYRCGTRTVRPTVGLSEHLLQELGERVQIVVGKFITLMYQRTVHLDHFNARVTFPQGRDVRIVLPDGRAGRADIRLELTGIGEMQIADGGGQHGVVTQTLVIGQD